VIAYILDAFVFRIKSDKEKCEKHRGAMFCTCRHFHEKVIDVTLNATDINKIKHLTAAQNQMITKKQKCFSISMMIRKFRRINFDLISSKEIIFIGRRFLNTREDLSLQIYQKDLQDWIDQREEESRLIQNNPPKEQPTVAMVLWKIFKNFLSYILE
jgi:hypothetical protein